jgi:ABC-2 type transport system permease protein
MRRLFTATRLFFTQALAVELAYRFALAQSFLGVAFGFLGLILFWLAAARNGNAASIYSPGVLVAYFIVASAHGILHESRLSWNLSMGIRMGKLSASMLRPYPYLLTAIAQAAAHATLRILVMAPILALVVAFLPFFHDAAAQISGERLAWFLAALVVSLAAGWLIKIALGLLAFDMTQTWGPELIFLSIYSVASGIGYPADLLPAGILAVVRWTPVYYMIGFPTLVLLGRVDAAACIEGLGRGVVVSIVTGIVVWLMWRRGMRQFEAVGI